MKPITCVTPCPLCGSTHAESVARVDGKTGEPLLTVNCSGCGLGRIDPLPTPQALEAWYTNHYRQDYKGAFQPALRHVLRAGRNALDRWGWLQLQLQSLGRALPEAASTLDIGASSGEFVYLSKQRGNRSQGIEPHAGYAAHARETLDLAVENGSLHQLLPQKNDDQFDLVSMFHVLEHLTDPVATLELIRRKTAPDGCLLIEVPNATRFCSPRYMFFKAHTLYFTQASLHQMLRAAGWNVVAHNRADDDNLMVLAQPASPDAASTAPAWQPCRALVEAQQRRTWPAYLADQLTSGRVMQKMSRRREEKRTARGFDSARAVLDHLYRNAHSRPPEANQATITTWVTATFVLTSTLIHHGLLES